MFRIAVWVRVVGVCVVLGEGVLMGVEGDAAREWIGARRGFEDGLLGVARMRLENFIRKYGRVREAMEARVMLAKIYYDEGLYEEVERLVGSAKEWGGEGRTELDYVLGENALARGRWVEAEQVFRRVLGGMPSAELTQRAQLGLAWALLKQGKRGDGMSLLSNVAINYAGTDVGQEARMIRVRLLIADGKYEEAKAELRAFLQESKGSRWEYEAWVWLGELQMLEAGYADAITSFLRGTEIGRAHPRWVVAQGLTQLGRAYQATNLPQKALEAYEKAFYAAEQEEQKVRALRAWLSTAKELKVLDGVLKGLMDEGRRMGGYRSFVDYEVAEFLIENGRESEAVELWERVAEREGDSRWGVAAMLRLIEQAKLNKQWNRAERYLQEILDVDRSIEVVARANFLLGELRYMQGAFGEAQVAFNLAGREGELAEIALFNEILCVARQGNLEQFLRMEREFLRRFSQSVYRDKLLEERARVLEQRDQKEDLVKTYEEALKTSVDPERRVELMMRLAESYEGMEKLSEAKEIYDDVVMRYKGSSLYVEAAYRRAFVYLKAGIWSEEEVRENLFRLWEGEAKHGLAPYVLFTVAELDFNRKDFANAQLLFEKLVQDYPQSELVDQALFFAGQSSAGHGDYARAISLLDKISERANEKNQARLLQGRLYQQQGQFQSALMLYEAVLSREKEGPLYIQALLGKGDCLFALGSSLGTRYQEAAEAYRTLISSNFGDVSQRNEAGYKYGKCLEKMGKIDEALAIYMEVVRGRIRPTGSEAIPEYFWTIKAGLNATDILSARKDWQAALEVYKAMAKLGGPYREQFQEMINRLRRDHFLYVE
ncbi:MAG: tetratricopeptide repeat protein [Methylacidiphilales bacterium]|nr:tetratricopeptide repeat protein [Candidatus Methylacidiphilales bacterium]MDW8349520.1 tetratricopeptide repeat protein [Verrucomicrobiae bacterium]